jgi:hypothetical protein
MRKSSGNHQAKRKKEEKTPMTKFLNEKAA